MFEADICATLPLQSNSTCGPVMAELLDTNDQNFSEIIIIGGGMSGLAAANNLVQNGVTNFKILEARNKIGGRIEVAVVGCHKVEMGASSIHGVLGNPMYEIASAHGLIDIVQTPKVHNVVAAMENGSQVPFAVLQEICEAYLCFLKRCEEYYLCQYLPPEGISSVGDHIRFEIALYLDKISDPKERHMKHLIFECLLKRETCITGCDDMKEIDLLELGSYTELQGGNIVLPGGYSSILQPIACVIPPENIIFNHPVNVVNWRRGKCSSEQGYDSGIDLLANGDNNNDSDSDKTVTGGTPTPRRTSVSGRSSCEQVTKQDTMKDVIDDNVFDKLSEISDDKESDWVEVICENETKFYCRHVICTVPLGVLKERGESLFSPKLPPYKLESINKLSFGTVNKIYLEYSRPFLHADVTEVMLLWDTEDSDEDNLEESWFKKIYSFSKVTETVILGWISGKESKYMETLPNSIVGEKCTEVLRKFLNDPYIPLPKSCVYSNWHKQKFFRGSYTSIAVGASQLDIDQIARPLYTHPQQKKPVLLFAGEHTHRSFYSTVHGAYLSGKNAAQIILTGDLGESFDLTCNDTSDSNDLSSWVQGISLD